MNDMMKHAAYWLAAGDVSPIEIGTRLNEIPMSALSTTAQPTAFHEACSRAGGHGRIVTVVAISTADLDSTRIASAVPDKMACAHAQWQIEGFDDLPPSSCQPSSTLSRPTSVWRIEPSNKCQTTNPTPLSGLLRDWPLGCLKGTNFMGEPAAYAAGSRIKLVPLIAESSRSDEF